MMTTEKIQITKSASPKGYKQTEVGLIPEDWKTVKIGDILEFKNGLNKESEFFGYGTPIINYMDVFRFNGIRKLDIVGKVFLSSQEKKNFSAKKDDVFFTRTSEIQEEIGMSAVLLEDIPDCVFSGFVLRGRPKNKIISSEYFQYCLTPNYVRSQIISTSSYTTRALTNGRYLSNVKISFPPTLTEQCAIATALSDVDALIGSLEQLIAKKKAIKQGAMQELLTPPHKGGKRLAGFSGEWEENTLNSLLNFGSGEDYKHLGNGDIPVYGTGGVMTFVNDFLYEGESVGIGRKGTIDKPVFLTGKFWTVDTLFFTYNFVNCIPKYIYYNFLIIPWKEYNEASGVPSLNKNTLGKIEIFVPPTIEEQKAIAQILSDMDLEIAALESKKEKYVGIKQGMMQELLTGKIRLV